MNFAALQQHAYRDYRKSRGWWTALTTRPVPRSKFDLASACAMQDIGTWKNPSVALAKGYSADWIDIAIEAVLKLIAQSLGYELSATELAVWRTIVRIVLQFLISAMLMLQKSAAYAARGSFDQQVHLWAVEAGASI